MSDEHQYPGMEGALAIRAARDKAHEWLRARNQGLTIAINEAKKLGVGETIRIQYGDVDFGEFEIMRVEDDGVTVRKIE